MVWALASGFPFLSLPWSADGHFLRYRRSEVRLGACARGSHKSITHHRQAARLWVLGGSVGRWSNRAALLLPQHRLQTRQLHLKGRGSVSNLFDTLREIHLVRRLPLTCHESGQFFKVLSEWKGGPGHCADNSRRQCEQRPLGLCSGHSLDLSSEFLQSTPLELMLASEAHASV